eukprot:3583640-Amphidinium_carterae.1
MAVRRMVVPAREAGHYKLLLYTPEDNFERLPWHACVTHCGLRCVEKANARGAKDVSTYITNEW